jgi:hypothetical protein
MTDGPKTIDAMSADELLEALTENAISMCRTGALERKFRQLADEARQECHEMLQREIALELALRRIGPDENCGQKDTN